MTTPHIAELIATGLFAVAVLHTFSTKYFAHLAHSHPRHAGLFHLLGEVEVVFGFWSFVLMAALILVTSKDSALAYLDQRNFTEPMFVFVIMVVAGTKSVLQAVLSMVRQISRAIPLPPALSVYFLSLFLVPLLGSFITEPAAMTLAALMLRDAYFSRHLSSRLKYATLGVLFVNVSIGGTLTTFAAPPVLMVASKWQWDIAYMFSHFGWKAMIAVGVNALAITLAFRREIVAKGNPDNSSPDHQQVPGSVVIIHLLFLLGIVMFAHYPPAFIGLLLLFMGFASAYPRYQDRLILREGLLVAFFLAGLVVLGGLQQWWLQPALQDVGNTLLFFIAVGLTAITDNAALTYLGSLVEGTDAAFRYALVAGAVAGGGLTVIANAPNPAGLSILKQYFPDNAVSPLGLLLAALPPTLVAIVAFIGFS
jgi:Na+/H+ antiporter NhaD/arsenite permease-like protein